ncbi:signal peptidase I [Candidatus Saccharibacteria bacterium]|nr:signal peptidase I [Candidatus Saccharibacteria bacterium]
MHIKRGNKTVLALEIAFLLIATIYITLLTNASDLVRYLYVICILLFFCIFSIRHLGYKLENSFLKTPTIWLIIATAGLFVLILATIGVFTDFTTANQPTFDSLYQKILPLFIISVEMELFRYAIVGKVEKNVPVLIAFALISSTLFLADIPHEVAEVGNNVVIITTITLTIRILATSFLCTYLSNHFGYVAALLYRLIVTLGILISPIWPQMGAPLTLILAIAFPIFTFIVVRHHEIFAERNHSKARSFNLSFFSFPVIVILAFFAILNSGITGYEMIAIASNSMRPTYSRGDIVIYKRNDPSEIQVNDILVFKRGNRLITHHVIEIRGTGEDRRFIVKGDHNEDADDYSVSADDVRGTVRVVGHYIGYPSLLLNGISETEE